MGTLVYERLNEKENELPKWYFPRRYNIIFLSFFAITLAYMMRANLSIAILDMSKEFGWKVSNKGMYLSSFFWGYITTQLVGGMAARKFGPKNMLLFVIIVPSCFTMLIPLVAAKSEMLFIACRVLTGVAAGATFPTTFLQIGGWVPFHEKAISLAIVFSGVNAGTIIIDVVGPKIMDTLGWAYVFYISGGVGFIWVIFWFFTTTSTPDEMKNIHPNEVKLIRESLLPVSEITPLNNSVPISSMAEEAGIAKLSASPAILDSKQALSILMSNSSFWNIVFCSLCTNWGAYIFLTWLPTYVNSELHFSIQLSGIIAITPNMSSAVVSFTAGKICDILLARGFRLLYVRKTFFFLGCFFYIGTLLTLAYKDSLGLTNVQAAIVLATGTGASGFHLPGFTANIYDIAPYHPSLVVGISNTAGTIPGIVGVFITGILLERGMAWGSIWLMVAAFYFAAMIINFIFCNVKRLV